MPPEKPVLYHIFVGHIIIYVMLTNDYFGFIGPFAIMPRLRGHHLICLHFFGGEGYSKEFVENLKSVLATAGRRPVEIYEGPDDVCRKCFHLKNEVCGFSDCADEEIRKMDQRALDLLRAVCGTKALWEEIRQYLPRIFGEWYTSYCRSCGWRKACENNGFFRDLVRTLK